MEPRWTIDGKALRLGGNVVAMMFAPVPEHVDELIAAANATERMRWRLQDMIQHFDSPEGHCTDCQASSPEGLPCPSHAVIRDAKEVLATLVVAALTEGTDG